MYLVHCAVTNSVDAVLQHLDMKMQYRHSRDAVLRRLVMIRRHNSDSMTVDSNQQHLVMKMQYRLSRDAVLQHLVMIQVYCTSVPGTVDSS